MSVLNLKTIIRTMWLMHNKKKENKVKQNKTVFSEMKSRRLIAITMKSDKINKSEHKQSSNYFVIVNT